jgi:hypothetical protein
MDDPTSIVLVTVIQTGERTSEDRSEWITATVCWRHSADALVCPRRALPKRRRYFFPFDGFKGFIVAVL